LGSQNLSIKIRFMVCNDTSCLPPQTKTVSADLEVQAGSIGATVSAPSGGSAPDELSQVAEDRKQDPGRETESGLRAGAEGRKQDPGGATGSRLPAGTLPYIWFAMSMGALALLTPCVFPMIPITVSYFTKRDAKSRGRAVFEAGLYSIGIIATFSFLGFLLTFLFGAGGINRLAANPMVNLLIAAVFIVFALSLFGVLEIGLPSTWLSAISKKSTQSTGLLGILLMALTFSLTSFTCTVPFVGTVMVAALQGDFLWSLLGVTAFAAVFSLPFFLLALFPSWLQSLPKSGNWMNSVKVTMGFLELAAAMKFLSNVDLVFQWEILTRPVFITVWLAIGLVTTGYLLGWFRFAHESPGDAVGALRVLFAIFFLAVSLFLFRGLFGFSLGELDAFLPPRDYGISEPLNFGLRTSGEPTGQEEKWLSNYDAALQRAAVEKKPLFVDFTGYTCTNCRWMESNIFTLPEVQDLFDRYILVRLYTDGTGPEHEANRRLEEERFSTIALPFYALISPADETIATFPGLTRDRAEFIRFLESGL
jgi:thiol:disulfide interchange protein DsbD